MAKKQSPGVWPWTEVVQMLPQLTLGLTGGSLNPCTVSPDELTNLPRVVLDGSEPVPQHDTLQLCSSRAEGYVLFKSGSPVGVLMAQELTRALDAVCGVEGQ